MDLARLQELKQKLLHEERLAPVWEFFLSRFGENPEFIALGERARHPFVETVVAEVGRQMYPREAEVSGLLLTRVPGRQFLHGAFSVGGRIGGVIYFEDARVGLVVVPDKPPSIEVKYARFSGHPVRSRGEPSRN
jgi:hypothetical protein